MNWAWANTLDQMWRSPTFPMWLTVAAAAFFAVILLVTLLRAEKSVANGALTVITLLAVGVALAATARGFGSGAGGGIEVSRVSPESTLSLPALACVDDLAGETVLTACEKVVFGSPESTAAALSYASRQITRLMSFGDVATANNNMTPEIEALRRAVEHDRYGLMAQVLVARDHCTPSDCAVFKSLTDRSRIASNIEEQTYDGLVGRYSNIWNAPPAVATNPPVAALIPGVPTGRPTNAEFPSAASTPAVSIMTAEPATTSHAPAPPAATPMPSPRPTASTRRQATSRPAPHTPTPATSLAPTALTPAASPN
ncbi:hypothetical protein [Bradyrhizobium sp.]|uniref:hypothetical protein n=1 Tax=Bradyrhizobium sp. TaxID=376 RepID=UPI0023A204ED|nr:hypothetical protein [Bradyrhizobium sp.]MDE1932650.1 hypothetical protein [Bradyrhizobium sp.]